jgi:acetyl/propionyl-CoA carboxylase alpha subunit
MPSYVATSGGRAYRVAVHTDAADLHVRLDDQAYLVDVLPVGPAVYSILLDGRSYEVDCHEIDGAWIVLVDGQPFRVELTDEARPRPPIATAVPRKTNGSITAPMSGKVVNVHVNAGDDLAAGAPVCTLEAMKMENEIIAPARGTVRVVHVRTGQTVRAGQTLVEMEPAPGGPSTNALER